MKRLLVALAVPVLVVAVAAVFFHYRTATVVVVRHVSGTAVIEISGPLDGAGARKVVRALHRADKNRQTTVLISFNSPGGEIAGTLELAEVIGDSSVQTIVWVKEGFGGTVIMMAAADQIYFSPKGICGAAGFSDSESGRVNEKIVNYIGAKVRSLAEANGHDPDVFLAMIDSRTELIRGFKVWKTKGQLMSLTASEALEIGLSAGTVESPEELIAKRIKTADTNQALQPRSWLVFNF